MLSKHKMKVQSVRKKHKMWDNMPDKKAARLSRLLSVYFSSAMTLSMRR